MEQDITQWIKELIANNKVNDFYRCRPWRKARKLSLEQYHYECQECKRNGRLTIIGQPGRPLREGEVRGIVHHKKPLRIYPELALDLNNLEPECWECHNKIEKQNTSTIVTEEFW